MLCPLKAAICSLNGKLSLKHTFVDKYFVMYRYDVNTADKGSLHYVKMR